MKPAVAPADKAAGKTVEDASSGTTTRQIVTEGKDAPPADAPRDGVPPPAAPAEAAPTPDKAETAPPPGPAPKAPPPHLPPKPPFPSPPSPPPPGPKPEEVIIAMQTELKRVGCDPGEIDGAWRGQSREALAAFGHFAKVDVGKLAPTTGILDVIKSKADIVCAAPAPEHHAAPPSHYNCYGGGVYGGGGGY